MKKTDYTRSFLGLFFLLLIAIASPAQEPGTKAFEKLEKKANDYYEYERYNEALETYEQLLSIKPEDPFFNYRVGMCHMHTVHQENALKYFEQAKSMDFETLQYDKIYINDHNHIASENIDFNLGRCYHLHHDFDKAIEYYKLFETELDPDAENLEEEIEIMEYLIQEAKNGKELIKHPVEGVKIENLGPEINSKYPEYAPVISADESFIAFTTRRPTTTGGKTDFTDDDHYMEDIMISYKKEDGSWGEPESISSNINTVGHDATAGMSPDGEKLIIYRSDKKHFFTGDLYYSKLKDSTWSQPVKFPEGINSDAWEGSASISSGRDELFFSSNREGGEGGIDIYMARKLPSGEWGVPVNMGEAINTEYDEDAPFIHPDGKTLYFSSKGHNSMGGYDIFESKLNEETGEWSKAKNVGYPINTAYDDIFFVWSADGKRAYYAAHHEDGYGEMDLYMMTRPEEKVSLIVLKGKILSKETGEPLQATLKVIDNETQELIGIYNSNSASGKYTVILKPGRNYGLSVEDENLMPYSENINLPDIGKFYEKEKNIYLQPLERGSKMTLNNVFFDYDKASIRKESYTELDKFVKLLKKRPNIQIEIAGHTDSIGSAQYNRKLSQRRAESIVAYLSDKGIDSDRMVAHGYGKKFPVATNKTEEGRQLNRRTEIIIHDVKEEGTDWKKAGGYYYQHHARPDVMEIELQD